MTLTSESEALLDQFFDLNAASVKLTPRALRRALEDAKAQGAAAERERIAAALPEALATALGNHPHRMASGSYLKVRDDHLHTGVTKDCAGAILAHPALRAILAPEGDGAAPNE